ncbi:MAG: YbjN domain-containing protein [Nitratireductor sp.]
MSLLELELEREMNPVDMIEQVASVNDWDFERSGDDEINVTVSGLWADYSVSFSWMEDFEALHLACAFDLRVPERRSAETVKLLSLVNEQLLIGHFDLWAREGVIMFRQSLLLNGGAEPNGEQLECLLSSALEACERYFQAFQFVVWAGKTAQEALDGALFETQGNA